MEGIKGWQKFALEKPEAPPPNAGRAERNTYKLKAAHVSAMTGRKPAPPPPANAKFVPPKKKKKGGGCS